MLPRALRPNPLIDYNLIPGVDVPSVAQSWTLAGHIGPAPPLGSSTDALTGNTVVPPLKLTVCASMRECMSKENVEVMTQRQRAQETVDPLAPVSFKQISLGKAKHPVDVLATNWRSAFSFKKNGKRRPVGSVAEALRRLERFDKMGNEYYVSQWSQAEVDTFVKGADPAYASLVTVIRDLKQALVKARDNEDITGSGRIRERVLSEIFEANTVHRRIGHLLPEYKTDYSKLPLSVLFRVLKYVRQEVEQFKQFRMMQFAYNHLGQTKGLFSKHPLEDEGFMSKMRHTPLTYCLCLLNEVHLTNVLPPDIAGPRVWKKKYGNSKHFKFELQHHKECDEMNKANPLRDSALREMTQKLRPEEKAYVDRQNEKDSKMCDYCGITQKAFLEKNPSSKGLMKCKCEQVYYCGRK